jgi:hypothetical protein
MASLAKEGSEASEAANEPETAPPADYMDPMKMIGVIKKPAMTIEENDKLVEELVKETTPSASTQKEQDDINHIPDFEECMKEPLSDSEIEKLAKEIYLNDPAAAEIKATFANIKIEPKIEELGQPNMPKNLHNACELFVMVQLLENSVRCANCINKYLGLIAANPDGTSKNNMGRACICWNCGYVGLPENAAHTPKSGVRGVLPLCKNCKQDDETNWVKPLNSKKKEIPWMENVSKVKLPKSASVEAAQKALAKAEISASAPANNSSKGKKQS